jgi:hypothetical protein
MPMATARRPEPHSWFGLLAGDAGVDGSLPGRVLPLTGGQDLAEDDLVDLAGVDLGALQGGGERNLAEVVGRRIGERAVERADGGARGPDDDDCLSILSGHENPPPVSRGA